jgi:hypothetical protein
MAAVARDVDVDVGRERPRRVRPIVAALPDSYLDLRNLATYAGLSVRVLRNYLRHPARTSTSDPSGRIDLSRCRDGGAGKASYRRERRGGRMICSATTWSTPR